MAALEWAYYLLFCFCCSVAVVIVVVVVNVAVGCCLFFTLNTGLRNELLLAAGNEPGNGRGKVWYTSRYDKNATVVDLGGSRVSSACGVRHPSRCRDLFVNSTRHGDYLSSHAVFLPLDRGFYVVEIAHNGSASGPNYTSHQSFVVEMSPFCPLNCTSLGLFKVGVHYYSVCATLFERMCTCQLDRNENSADYFLRSCQTYHLVGTGSILSEISNIVSSTNPRQRFIYFFVGSVLFYVNPVYGSSRILINNVCPSVSHLTLEGHNLYIYCTNLVSAVYNLNDGTSFFTRPNQLFYPCSPTANVTINLGIADRVSNLIYTSEDAEMPAVLPSMSQFEFGMCFTLRNNSTHTFLYLDRNNGVYIFNITTSEFFHVNNTQGCLVDRCQWPQLFNNRYLAVRECNPDSLAVFDIESAQTPILKLSQVSYLVAVVIDDTLISQLPEMDSASHTTNPSPVTSNFFTEDPTITTEDGEINIAGTVLIVVCTLSFLIIVSLLVAITVTLVIQHCR